MLNIKDVVLKGRNITVLHMWYQEQKILGNYFEANVEVSETITYVEILKVLQEKVPDNIKLNLETFTPSTENGQMTATIQIEFNGVENEICMGILPNIYEYEGKYYNLVDFEKDVKNKFIKY